MNLSECIHHKKPNRFLIHTLFTPKSTQELFETTDKTWIRGILKDTLNPEEFVRTFTLDSDWLVEEKSEILLDFYVFAFEFCTEQVFSPAKIGVFLELMQLMVQQTFEFRLSQA